MSILIEGMEMPTKKNAVILITPSGDVWMIGNMPNEDTHLVKAKAVPISEPHGRLGDLDALPWYLANKSVKYASYEDWEKLCDAIQTAPTIIRRMSEDCSYYLYNETEERCKGCFCGSNYRPKPADE